ncbi:dynamin family protein [Paenibacillus sp. Soil724D2]|uniref:dynamin family protein n=1 Tax=Paenibacillus sp. (strain Soil724D2) TaxID=1736392 RepID=UPI0007154C3D|nr:dynamin family protein [Paenibacillus sp. Soil724D2]KRE50632.1 hypothetical protein ASG85_20480 [Paenibacillus sp. Soil724D2]
MEFTSLDYELESMVSKINLDKHPILKENYSIRYSYVVFIYIALKSSKRNNEQILDIMNSYKTAFHITEHDFDKFMDLSSNNETDLLQKGIRLIGYDKNWLLKWKFIEANYCILLLAELLFLNLSNFEQFYHNKIIQLYSDLFEIAPSTTVQIRLILLKILAHENVNSLLENKKLSCLSYFYHIIQEHRNFDLIKQPRVLIIATMSSGKSTVLNALIGKQMFPSENKACTSKIVEFTNNPVLRKEVGVASGTLLDSRRDVTYSDVTDWNHNPDVSRIQLEGRVHSYSELKGHKISFMDTPGTNNSRDREHGEITYNILQTADIDMILYVLNVTNLASEDDSILLKNVLKVALDKNIIFLLNKVDQLDLDADDDMFDSLNIAIKYITDHGVKSPTVIPISAYAASLFTYALEGRELTRKETRDLLSFYSLFQIPEYDMNVIARNLNSSLSISEVKIQSHIDVQVGNIVLSSQSLQKALNKTGIGLLERFLLQLTS